MINERSFEDLVKAVTREVVRELAKQSEIRPASACQNKTVDSGSERLDMSAYKTPLVTESSVRRLHELTRCIVVPKAVLVTPRAKELLRERNIQIIYDNK
jgi:hypothetical protein